MDAKAQEQAKVLAAEGEAFLAENAKKEGVVVTESGLQYEVLTEGTGEKPSASSTVRTHYHGTLINGEVFDSSVERDQPAEFPVGGVIAGWTEALQLMNVGSKWKLYIPYHLAYGERGAGGGLERARRARSALQVVFGSCSNKSVETGTARRAHSRAFGGVICS